MSTVLKKDPVLVVHESCRISKACGTGRICNDCYAILFYKQVEAVEIVHESCRFSKACGEGSVCNDCYPILFYPNK